MVESTERQFDWFFKLVTFKWQPYLSIIGCIAANDLNTCKGGYTIRSKISVCSTCRTNFVVEWYVDGIPVLLEIF